jgi:hypothetical protein
LHRNFQLLLQISGSFINGIVGFVPISRAQPYQNIPIHSHKNVSQFAFFRKSTFKTSRLGAKRGSILSPAFSAMRTQSKSQLTLARASLSLFDEMRCDEPCCQTIRAVRRVRDDGRNRSHEETSGRSRSSHVTQPVAVSVSSATHNRPSL